MILKHSRSVSLGLIVSLVADTWPALTPHAQRMKSPEWSAAVVVYSLSFLCSASNLMAAAFTLGMSYEGSLVPVFMIVSSQGAAKKDATPGWEKAVLIYMQFVLHADMLFCNVLPFCIRQNIFVRLVDIFHSITNEWAKFDTKDVFSFIFSRALPTSTTLTKNHSTAATAAATAAFHCHCPLRHHCFHCRRCCQGTLR